MNGSAEDRAALAAALRAHLEWQRELGREGFRAPAGVVVERAAAPVARAVPARAAVAAAAPGSAPAPAPRAVSVPIPAAGPVPDPAAVLAPAATGVEADPAGRAAALQALGDELRNCPRCRLSQTRTNVVYGVGNPRAQLMFVGEAPGADEDRQGEPFVGAAGQKLDQIIQAIGLRREDVYIANVLKCRPPGNRNPAPDEVAECAPFLFRQISYIQPRVLVALGKFAMITLLGQEAPISRLRGRFHAFQGIPVMPTYHPAYLLRNPDAKRLVWEDMKQVKAKLDALAATPA